MQNDGNKILIDSIQRLLRRGATSHLRKIMNRTHAADLSAAFRSLPLASQHKLFQLIEDPEKKGALLTEMDEDAFKNFVEKLKIDEMVDIFEHMPTDDVADLIGPLPEDTTHSILKKMKREGSEEVEGLLRYPEDTAGGIMVPDFIALPEDITAGDAIKLIQKDHIHVEMPFYLYAVDSYQKLVGVSSLRQLVVVPSETPLRDFMCTDVVSVKTDTDQEEVARIVARYDILAVPVVDETNRLVGIVTVDDVIDIIREEAAEDMLKMAGVSEEFIEGKSVVKSARIRLPWLFASCIGGIVAFFVISRFESSLTRFSYLAAFIPVIMGMGGNVGTQSATIVVRGLATGRFQVINFWSVVSREFAIGFFLGAFYGCLIGVVAQMSYSISGLALSVGLSVICSMSVATLVGSMAPLLFARAGIDPAVATGPFVTTAIDIISVYFYFKIVAMLLGI